MVLKQEQITLQARIPEQMTLKLRVPEQMTLKPVMTTRTMTRILELMIVYKLILTRHRMDLLE